MMDYVTLLILLVLLNVSTFISGSFHFRKPPSFNSISVLIGKNTAAKSQSLLVNVNHQYNITTDSEQTHKSLSRDLEFWRRSIQIFSSYKRFQLKLSVSKVLNRFQSLPKNTEYQRLIEDGDSETSSLWNEIHELNSDRMYRLCVDLRGFYLKAGQFLGTRYDFMPVQYTSKLSKLHDDVTPLSEEVALEVIEQELKSSWKSYFTKLDMSTPLGAASIAQVHLGIWKATNEHVAVKIQYPNAEKLMKSDLNNLCILGEFLQRTELKFDLLTCIKELQRRIVNEFDFLSETTNLHDMRENLMPYLPNVMIPKPIYATRRLLVMSYVEGENLGRLAEFRDKPGFAIIPAWMKQRFGKKLLDVLSTAWGRQIFVLKRFNADPHPGNICIQSKTGVIGLLDWGQVVTIPNEMVIKLALANRALCSRSKEKITQAMLDIGIILKNPSDIASASDIGTTLLDTRNVAGYVINPFQPGNALKKNSVLKFPSDLYFVIRSIQLMRGIAYGFGLDYSLADRWSPYAEEYLRQQGIR